VPRLLPVLLALALALSFACAGGGATPAATSTPAATATRAPTATPVDLGPAEPEVDRVLEHARVLSEDVGIRVAGSPEQQEAAQYARAQLESWGYDVELQPFSDSDPRLTRFSKVVVEGAGGAEFHAVAFAGSGLRPVSGPLVDAGTGREEEFPPDVEGALVLIQRQDVPFVDMAARAQARGASGVVVANKEPGLFGGALEPAADVPMAGVSQEDGDELRRLLAERETVARLEVPAEVRGTNVIARPPSGQCLTVSGGHIDTVPWAPGATDNASGSALVLELARASAAAGLTDHCFALFDGEEEGLVGSRHFVSALDSAERQAMRAYYNYDVVAGDARIIVIGDDRLIEDTIALGAEVGVPVEPGRLPEGAGSDFASFRDAGIPTVMLTVDDLGIIHTPEDTFENLQAAPIGPIARLGFALLSGMAAAPAAAP
jgi:aminopeptidase YwaD